MTDEPMPLLIDKFQNWFGLENNHRDIDTYNNMSIVLSNTGRLADAVKVREVAIAIQEKLVKAEPTVTEYQEELASSQCTMVVDLQARPD